MKWIKRIAIVVLSCLALAFVVDFALNWWIAAKLPRIINRENDTPYQITYKDLDISLLGRNLTATEVVVVPKASLHSTKTKAGLYANIGRLEINGFGMWSILFGDRIKARNLIVEKPEVTLFKKNDRALDNAKSISSEVVKPFSKIITVSDVFLNHGSIQIIGLDNRRILAVANINIKLEGIAVTEETLSQKIPFTFRTYAVDCDSLFYQSNSFYHMVTRKIATTESGLSVKDFKMIPEFPRREFVNRLKQERDIYAIAAANINLNNMDWRFNGNDFAFHAQSLVLDDVNADIFRSKIPKDDPKKKKLYSEMLRNVPFALKIDTVLLRRSKIVYEEELDAGRGPGALTFSQFNMRVTGLQSGFRQTKMEDVNIKIDCRFMETSLLEVDWTFNVLDKADSFNIRGRFFDFPAERISPFTKPYLNATFKGSLDEVYFNFSGNDNGSKGDFAINYDDLKVSIYKKKQPKKKNKIVSAIANLFVKDDTKDKVTTAKVSVPRAQDRSFFNLLWKSMEEGLKKVLL
ncbi:DUF748 domain-containing protein [Flavobacterium longum]|uniref:hypothetical protein n=1 Tax=Flavobacterium longum TaxID=1299340 RepID=UPI0039ED3E05